MDLSQHWLCVAFTELSLSHFSALNEKAQELQQMAVCDKNWEDYQEAQAASNMHFYIVY